MKYSEFFLKTTKDTPKDEVSLNAQLLIRGGFVDKLSAGVYSILPLGQRVYKKIEQIIREEMIAIGGQEMFMPSLHPKEIWDMTGRYEAMGEDLFKIKLAENKELVLGPTHEEVITPIAKRFVQSYRDLPVSVFQFQNKFRHELRAKSGILRGKEFVMKDLYSFHTDEKDLDVFYEKAKQAYERIFQRFGIGEKTYLTYASGGTFSKYSHEFQTLTSAGEDIIHICDQCRVAVNKEIIEDQAGKCPVCGQSNLRQEKAVEVGNIFKLMTKFSQPFDLYYQDQSGEKKIVIMGCYGIGLQRSMGTIVEVSHDDRGIIWPAAVAPFQVHLIALNQDKNEIAAEADSVYQSLLEKNIEVFFDDRLESSPGEKFADADLIGCPLRVVVSEKSLAQKGLEIKARTEKDSRIAAKEELFTLLNPEK